MLKARSPLWQAVISGLLTFSLSVAGHAATHQAKESKNKVQPKAAAVKVSKESPKSTKKVAKEAAKPTVKVASKATKASVEKHVVSKTVVEKHAAKVVKNEASTRNARLAERELVRKQQTREKLARISRTGKVARVVRNSVRPAAAVAAVVATTKAVAVAPVVTNHVATTAEVAPTNNTATVPSNTVASLAPATPAALTPRTVAAPEVVQSPDARLPLNLESKAALVMNAENGSVLYAKNTNRTMPIASITKLMTAMVVLDARLPLEEPITISEADVDHLRNTTSRLTVGTVLSRAELLLLALMSSENRAAAALARTYPGGTPAAVAAMNRKAASIGMANTVFYDPTGLNSGNSASPRDLVTMVKTATHYPLIHRFTTTAEHAVAINNRIQQFHNTNSLVKSDDWDIAVSKTGYINEAGRCLVMQARIKSVPVVIVLMDSWGKYTRIGDAQRVKKWLESALSASRDHKTLRPVV